jgi:hypothetical protein
MVKRWGTSQCVRDLSLWSPVVRVIGSRTNITDRRAKPSSDARKSCALQGTLSPASQPKVMRIADSGSSSPLCGKFPAIEDHEGDVSGDPAVT